MGGYLILTFLATIQISSTMTLGDLIVGAGTLMLAAFTCWLGFETRASARAARDAVERAEEPYVIATPTPTAVFAHTRDPLTESGEPLPVIHRAPKTTIGPLVRLRLWNIGSGPAIVEHVSLRREGSECLGDMPGGFRPIAAGQVADLEIPSPRWPPVLGDGRLTITYRHSNGHAYETRSVVGIGDPVVTVATYPRVRL